MLAVLYRWSQSFRAQGSSDDYTLGSHVKHLPPSDAVHVYKNNLDCKCDPCPSATALLYVCSYEALLKGEVLRKCDAGDMHLRSSVRRENLEALVTSLDGEISFAHSYVMREVSFPDNLESFPATAKMASQSRCTALY